MTVDEIKEILELMREHELAEFELQRDGETLRLRKHSPPQWTGPIAASVSRCRLCAVACAGVVA